MQADSDGAIEGVRKRSSSALPRWQRGLWAVTLAAVFLLLVSPQTRWLARVQWAASIGLYHPFPWSVYQTGINSYTLSLDDDRVRESAVAERHPQDLQIQMAYEVDGAADNERLARVRALMARFPDRRPWMPTHSAMGHSWTTTTPLGTSCSCGTYMTNTDCTPIRPYRSRTP